jgi:aminoglycoside phosphotransferase (APT) family kinase protein
MPDTSGSTSAFTPEDLSSHLQRYLAERSPGAGVTDFQFLTSGFESDIYTFLFHPAREAPRGLVLRLCNGEDAGPRIALETRGLKLLSQAGFPVAALFYSETEASFLGKPFTILEKLEGRSLWPVLAGSQPGQANELLERFCGLQAQLHRLDWRQFTSRAEDYTENPGAILEEQVAALRQTYTRFEVPGFLPLADWLERSRTTIQVHPAVVHLDFHANNVFLCADGRLAVIDWSQFSVADYRSDLSWTLMLMGDYGQADWRERILQGYQRQAGRRVEDLTYFNIVTDLKLLASMIISMKTGPAALGLQETAQPASQQAPILKRLAGRIQAATGLAIPEVEAALQSI